jgi:diguanylate cyclase (GGDEF)-like protein
MVRTFLRNLTAAARDLAADRRDEAARIREESAAADAAPSSDQRRMAARDRDASARDRRAAADDRKAAQRDLADSGVDALTGVMGRGAGLAALAREVARAERTGESLVLAYVDAVGLKQTNDTRGHREGDRLLREVAAALAADLRAYDVVVRLGGDEFACTHSGETIEQARRRYEEISTGLAAGGNDASFTVGLVAHRPGESLEDLIDRAMLAARNA